MASVLGRLGIIVADFATLLGCFYLGYLIRITVFSRFDFVRQRGEPISYEAYLFFVSIYIVVFALSGLYDRRVSAMEESVGVLRACFYATGVALILSTLGHFSHLYSRTVILISASLAAVLAPAGRIAVKSVLGRWKPWQRPVVMIGFNPNGLRAAQDLASDPTTGYRVAGIFSERAPESPVPWPVWNVGDRAAAIALSRKLALKSFILC